MFSSYLAAGQPAHDKVLLQAIILVLVSNFCSVGPLETSKGSPAGLRVEGVHHNRLCAFNLTAAKWAALTLRLLTGTHTHKIQNLRGIPFVFQHSEQQSGEFNLWCTVSLSPMLLLVCCAYITLIR